MDPESLIPDPDSCFLLNQDQNTRFFSVTKLCAVWCRFLLTSRSISSSQKSIQPSRENMNFSFEGGHWSYSWYWFTTQETWMTSDIRNALYGAFIFFQIPICGQCCWSGSRIRCFFDRWIRDGKKSRGWIPDHDCRCNSWWGKSQFQQKNLCRYFFFTFKEPGNRL